MASPSGARLTTSEYAVWKFDKDNSAHYHYGRDAVHHLLYTVANSKVMNGLMPGAVFHTAMTIAEKILLAVNIVSSVLILLLVFFTIRLYMPKKKEQV